MDIIKHEWGSEAIWANTKKYCGKMYMVEVGKKTSKAYHKKQELTIFVLEGSVELEIEGKIRLINKGESYHIHSKIVYSMLSLKDRTIILEAGTAHEDGDFVIVE